MKIEERHDFDSGIRVGSPVLKKTVNCYRTENNLIFMEHVSVCTCVYICVCVFMAPCSYSSGWERQRDGF